MCHPELVEGSLSLFPWDQRTKTEILLPRLRDQNDKALELGDRVQMRMAPPSNHSTKKLQPGRLFANNQELALHEIPNRPCNPKVLYRKVPGYRWTEIVGGI